MDAEQGRLVIYTPCHAPLLEFVRFWEKRYFEGSDRVYTTEKLYTTNINRPHHSVETLTELFKWKFGVFFFALKIRTALEHNFLSNTDKARELPPDVSAEDFLQKRFPNGGAISRIFWLHCWHPNDFPIYDQHVHRAMVFIRDGRVDELNNYTDDEKIKRYLQCYVPFFKQFAVGLPFDPELDGVPGRKADRALVTFGSRLKSKTFREMIAAL